MKVQEGKEETVLQSTFDMPEFHGTKTGIQPAVWDHTMLELFNLSHLQAGSTEVFRQAWPGILESPLSSSGAQEKPLNYFLPRFPNM